MNLIFNIVLALVGNKSDDYEHEKVKDAEGMELAQRINALYQRTSAKNGSGIDELFRRLGKQYLSPDSPIIINLTKEEAIKQSHKIKIEEIKEQQKNNKKKKCC